MPDFRLTRDQIGDLAADGSITKHPPLDIFGNPADRLNPTRKQLTLGGKRVFVVIPVGKDSEDNVYALADDKPAPKAKE